MGTNKLDDMTTCVNINVNGMFEDFKKQARANTRLGFLVVAGLIYIAAQRGENKKLKETISALTKENEELKK